MFKNIRKKIIPLTLVLSMLGTNIVPIYADTNGGTDSGIVGERWTFYYTGAPQELVLPETGQYKLEVYGAEGGGSYGGGIYRTKGYDEYPANITAYWGTVRTGGYGGYVSGYYNGVKNQILIVNVGGYGGLNVDNIVTHGGNKGTTVIPGTVKPVDGTNTNRSGPYIGGYNGGGGIYGVDQSANVPEEWYTSGYQSHVEDVSAYAGGGGGASDIRINGDDLTNRIIVGGGGGGSSSRAIYFYGGRYNYNSYNTTYPSKGGYGGIYAASGERGRNTWYSPYTSSGIITPNTGYGADNEYIKNPYGGKGASQIVGGYGGVEGKSNPAPSASLNTTGYYQDSFNGFWVRNYRFATTGTPGGGGGGGYYGGGGGASGSWTSVAPQVSTDGYPGEDGSWGQGGTGAKQTDAKTIFTTPTYTTSAGAGGGGGSSYIGGVYGGEFRDNDPNNGIYHGRVIITFMQYTEAYAPAVNITSSVPQDTLTKELTLTATATVVGGSAIDGSLRQTLEVTSNGTYSFTFRTVAGDEITVSYVVKNIDNTAPSVSVKLQED